MGSNTGEKRSLNKDHPDYMKMMAEVDVVREKFIRADKQLSSKYSKPISEMDGWRLAHELAPYRKQYNIEIQRIMDKYDYLYE